jgi:hypothetical protein
MPQPQLPKPPFPVIDSDPTFGRVVGAFRPSDYAVWAASTAAFPAGLLFFERINPMNAGKNMKPALRLATFLGVCGGFLLAYQRSSLRFWGWTENERERLAYQQQQQQRNEDASTLSPHLQTISAGNSLYAALRFDALPWFNFSNHSYRDQEHVTKEH